MTQPTPPNKPAPVLVLFLLLPLTGIVVALLMVAAERRAAPPTPEPLTRSQAQLINYNAPGFRLERLDGSMVTLADYAGTPLFLNFWQTTCEPCRREMPAFMDFFASEESAGLALLTVNFGEKDEEVRRFFAQYDIVGVPVAMDYSSDVRRAYGVANIPVTFIIDADGIVRYMHIGEMTERNIRQYAEIIRVESRN